MHIYFYTLEGKEYTLKDQDLGLVLEPSPMGLPDAYGVILPSGEVVAVDSSTYSRVQKILLTGVDPAKGEACASCDQ
jgi:hypothetical protein